MQVNGPKGQTEQVTESDHGSSIATIADEKDIIYDAISHVTLVVQWHD